MHTKNRLTPMLHGIIPPLVTPLLEDGSLDESGLGRLVDHVIGGGVHGLFVLGTTGEWASLEDPTRHRVLEVCAQSAAGRVPLYLHVTDTRLSASLALARAGAKVGAVAIVASAPYYLALQQTELLNYVQFLLDNQELPIVLYNIPQFSKTRYDPATVQRLLDNPRIIGMKDSGGDLAYQRKIIDLAKHRPDFAVLCGDERYMTEMLGCGAHGCVGGGANLLPQLLVSLYDAILGGDKTQAAQLQEKLVRLSVLYDAPSVAAGMGNVKSALHQLGIIATDLMCDPYGRPAPQSQSRVRTVLQSFGLLSVNPAVERHVNGRGHAAISLAS